MAEESSIVELPESSSGSKHPQFGHIYTGKFKDKNPDIRTVKFDKKNIN